MRGTAVSSGTGISKVDKKYVQRNTKARVFPHQYTCSMANWLKSTLWNNESQFGSCLDHALGMDLSEYIIVDCALKQRGLAQTGFRMTEPA